MSILLTNEIIFNYVKENPGLTSKEIADYFNTKASLLNKQFSDKHGHIYDKSWRGIYNIKGIGHSEYMHYVDEAVTYEDSFLENGKVVNMKDDEIILVKQVDSIISIMHEKVDILNIVLTDLNDMCLKYKNLQDSFKTMETHLVCAEKSLSIYKKEHYKNWKNMLFYVSFNWILILILILIVMGIKYTNSEVNILVWSVSNILRNLTCNCGNDTAVNSVGYVGISNDTLQLN